MSSNKTYDVIPINPNIDPYAYLGFIKNPDGSLTRISDILPTSPPPITNQVLSKDIPINQEKNTWARIYLFRPKPGAVSTTKQPLMVYYHGGGFVVGSPSSSMFQSLCSGIAHEIPAVFVSVEYRLAPEHRLPAAYDDCMEALHWIRNADDEWLTKYADYSKCFLMGTSAGGNIAYHVGLRAATCADDLMHIKIRGLILHHPFFGGVQRTLTEIRLANDPGFCYAYTDLMWELALPVGANRDHEYSNPMVGIKSDVLKKVKDQRWKVLVSGCHGDILIDRQIEFVKMLKGKGLDVIGEFSEGGAHGVELVDDSRAKVLIGVIKNFILSL